MIVPVHGLCLSVTRIEMETKRGGPYKGDACVPQQRRQGALTPMPPASGPDTIPSVGGRLCGGLRGKGGLGSRNPIVARIEGRRICLCESGKAQLERAGVPPAVAYAAALPRLTGASSEAYFGGCSPGGLARGTAIRTGASTSPASSA